MMLSASSLLPEQQYGTTGMRPLMAQAAGVVGRSSSMPEQASTLRYRECA